MSNAEAIQLSFLKPNTDTVSGYFVPHTGIRQVLNQVELALNQSAETFNSVYIYGGKGSGKTTLLNYFHEAALAVKFPENKLFCLDADLFLPAQEEKLTPVFIDVYERYKTEGGLLVVCSSKRPAELTKNPHLQSRLLAFQFFELNYPQDPELRPLIISLLEQRHLRIAEANIDYILERSSNSPLSLADISDKISRLSLELQRPVKRSLIKEVLAE